MSAFKHYGGITSAAVSTIRRKIREGTYPLAQLAEQMASQLTAKKSDPATQQ